jgi:hypothetical protein
MEFDFGIKYWCFFSYWIKKKHFNVLTEKDANISKYKYFTSSGIVL